MSNSRYLTAAETAKIVRKVLKREFPEITFGVTSETYSGGASISAQWIDGPTEKQVMAHIGVFAGKGFDGMIDLSYYKDCWMTPDGKVYPAKSQGSGNSGGMDQPYDLPAPSPDAELVHFGSGYIHARRHHSPALVRRVAAEMTAKTGWASPPIVETESYWSRTKEIPTAYFENWKSPEDRQNWEEFSQALYLTPGDAPIVTHFDYAFEEYDEEAPEPLQSPPAHYVPPTADERDYTDEPKQCMECGSGITHALNEREYHCDHCGTNFVPKVDENSVAHDYKVCQVEALAKDPYIWERTFTPEYLASDDADGKAHHALADCIARWADWNGDRVLDICYRLLEEANMATVAQGLLDLGLEQERRDLQAAPTPLEKHLYFELAQALTWLQNLAHDIGDTRLVDACPNNWGGRQEIEAALLELETVYPELADYSEGTYITDGIVRGFVLGKGSIQFGKRELPAYLIDIGGDREALILTKDATRA